MGTVGADRAVPTHGGGVPAVLDSNDRVTTTPRLDVDLAVVARALDAFRDALPEAEPAYAVKANPHPEVLALLAARGASVDLASVGELDACLLAGVAPARMSWGNPVKKPADVRAAVAAGVTRFTTDAPADVDLLARLAPGAAVTVRLGADDAGSATPFAGKFGVPPDEAAALLTRARDAGLRPHGLGFHPGSQQTDPNAWRRGIAAAARAVERFGAPVAELNVGGGFPTPHGAGPVPDLADLRRRDPHRPRRPRRPARRRAVASAPGRRAGARARRRGGRAASRRSCWSPSARAGGGSTSTSGATRASRRPRAR